MPDPEDTTAGEVQEGQAPATEVGESGGAEAGKSWVLGDETFTDPDRLYETAKRWMGEYTRTRQEYKKLRDESSAGQALMELVRSDPYLLAEVRARIRAGQSPQQAVQQAAQKDPRLDTVLQEWDSFKEEREAEKQEAATASFYEEHQDLTDEEASAVEGWLEENAEWLFKSGLDHGKMLNLAWSEVLKGRSGKLIEEGAKMKEEEYKRGKPLLGTQAPTANAAAPSKSTQDMNPAERLEYAKQIFQKNAPR